MRLIDADVLLEKAWDANTSIGYVQVVDVGDVIDTPTISPDDARGVGKWEMWEDCYGSNVYKCSVCGSDWDMIEGTPQDNDFKYCPNCGARMGGVQDALS